MSAASADRFKFLRTRVDEAGVAFVTFDRPPVNAVHQPMYRELFDLFTHPDQLGPDVRVIILHGNGPHFSAGNDLDEFASMTPENGRERMWQVRHAFFAIQDCAVPVIAAVHGVAVGTGLALLASCDFIVAEPDAKLGLPELTVGVMGGATHMARIAPQPVVRRMFFTGEMITAADLQRLGGALIVCEKGGLMAEAYRHAARIASLSPTAVRHSKPILNQVENMDLRPGYEVEQGLTVAMSGHPDSKEALKAFKERRPAEYQPYGQTPIRIIR